MVTRSKSRELAAATYTSGEEDIDLNISSEKDQDKFATYRREEISELTRMGCFKIVETFEAPGHRIYRTRFVDKMKPSGEKRSRLCIAACNVYLPAHRPSNGFHSVS